MVSWRDELNEAVKSKAEREAEEHARIRKRVEEALATASQAMTLGTEALAFSHQRLKDKGQPAEHHQEGDLAKLKLADQVVTLELARETAVVKVTFAEQKPREFDFAKDRHIAPADVEEYVGRRMLELVRNAYKTTPW
jgi:ADP-ribose pyrophosphatase YjhB (NUDIX family)